MTPRRLVLVTRRFWPLCGGPPTALAGLGVELAARGHRVTLLTARWQNDWPAEIDYRGVRVVRLPYSPRPWGLLRYLRAMSRWFQNHRGQVDLAYVSMLKHEACTAVAAGSRHGFPVALRAEGAGLAGDCHWQLDAVFGRRIKKQCFQAAAVVAPSPAIERELIAAGYPRDRICLLPNGTRPAGRVPAAARTAARRSLTESDPRWAAPFDGTVAVFAGQLVRSKGLEHLVAAWPAVVAARSDARLWLVGDGQQRASLESQIARLGIGAQAVLTGAFDEIRDFLTAADVFVLPSLDEGASMGLLEAMAHALPAVATDVPGNRALIEHEVHGLLVPPEDPPALAAAIGRLFQERELAERLGAAALKRVKEQFTLTRMVNQHLELFEKLLIPLSPG